MAAQQETLQNDRFYTLHDVVAQTQSEQQIQSEQPGNQGSSSLGVHGTSARTNGSVGPRFPSSDLRATYTWFRHQRHGVLLVWQAWASQPRMSTAKPNLVNYPANCGGHPGYGCLRFSRQLAGDQDQAAGRGVYLIEPNEITSDDEDTQLTES
ncbi:hypothetical protein H257_19144 [Aphanomyces astaci]|uniref:Uncharacterized protein n=1 Tax=Aphanomyces astaci TaxID=112090 RepID=W4F8Y8_APHAT|nr:hypothetical protein H257_19144 [Aphanomyces astaci]ETV63922.1 hypothetical protein H257_19144 [Aphanomyces astaci]|eukprot:XP_009846594.1 hypothetical protein H257_19144 [Aphanomyces astaci]